MITPLGSNAAELQSFQDEQRLLSLTWEECQNQYFNAKLQMVLSDCHGAMAVVTSVLADQRADDGSLAVIPAFHQVARAYFEAKASDTGA